MANINLLPWRDEFRAERKKDFFALFGVVLVFALLVAFGWDRTTNSRIDNQLSRNQLLQSEIANLEKQVAEIKDLKKKRQDMLDRIKVIQSLQSNRPEIVKIFDEFVRSVPDGLYFSSMNRTDESVSLQGYSESNNRVSALMRNLDSSYKFDSPNLTKVEADPTLGEQGSQFELNVNVSPAEQADGAGDKEGA